MVGSGRQAQHRQEELQCYSATMACLASSLWRWTLTVCKWKGETDGQGESKATATNSCRKTRLESGPERGYIEPSLVRDQTKLLYKL